ncbi:MAG: ABC transporter permease subunit [Aeromicrobium sp.]|uniref:ABC transporter permease subunit n=1 Tax=Aeromicrobium sp. TaxID=1871063 RepID=UPI0039E25200
MSTATIEPIPFTRLLSIELRKMFDTRSGFWLMASIVILSVLASVATLIFEDPAHLVYEDFATAIGVPMSIILPVVGVLSVTSEWSQRTALTTFTLVPSRGRVIAAKFVNVVLIGIVSMVVAIVVGALANLVGSAIAGIDPVWDSSLREMGQIALAGVAGMLVGFTLGVVVRSSAAAIVAYFVFKFVLPGISGALASVQQWWFDHSAWFDLNSAMFQLYDQHLSGTEWAQFGVTSIIWVVVPLAVGLRLLLRAEVK